MNAICCCCCCCLAISPFWARSIAINIVLFFFLSFWINAHIINAIGRFMSIQLQVHYCSMHFANNNNQLLLMHFNLIKSVHIIDACVFGWEYEYKYINDVNNNSVRMFISSRCLFMYCLKCETFVQLSMIVEEEKKEKKEKMLVFWFPSAKLISQMFLGAHCCNSDELVRLI